MLDVKNWEKRIGGMVDSMWDLGLKTSGRYEGLPADAEIYQATKTALEATVKLHEVLKARATEAKESENANA